MKFLRSYWPWLALCGLILIYIGYSITFLNIHTYVQNTTMLLKGGLFLNLALFIRKCIQWWSYEMYVGNIHFVTEVDRPRIFYFSIFYTSYLAIYSGFLMGANFLIDSHSVILSYVLTSIVAAAGAIAFGLLVLVCSRWFG